MRNLFRQVVLVIAGLIGHAAFSQEEEQLSTELDLLKAPASPASNMLGMANEEVARPTDLTSFMVSLRQASQDFTQLPLNYAVDVAPCWLLPGLGKHSNMTSMVKRQHLHKEGSTWGARVLQSLVVSTAVANLAGGNDSTIAADTKAGFGLKLSLFTPPAVQKAVDDLDAIRMALGAVAQLDRSTLSDIREDPVYKYHKRKSLDSLLLAPIRELHSDSARSRLLELMDAPDSDDVATLMAKVAALAEEFELERQGLFLDLSAGLAIEFVDRDFGNGQFRKGGLWLCGGYTLPGFTATAMGRALFEPPVEVPLGDGTVRYDDVRNIDLGGSIALEKNERNFTFSTEALLRLQQVGDVQSDTWRLVLNAGYTMKDNKTLTFSFGRNFDGTTTKDGNLVAGLNLLLGFGGKKKI